MLQSSALIPQQQSTLTRLAVLTMLLTTLGCSSNSADSMDHAAGALASWIGRSILDKLSREIAFQSKDAEIRTDLELLEVALARIDDRLHSRIRDLRQQLDSKTSIDDIRRVVDETVTELDARLQNANQETTTVEDRVRALEAIIGFVPTVTPSPLLRINAEGQPEAHALTVKWAKLLAASHAHWIEMEKLNQIYKPNAPQMRAAIQKHREFQLQAVTLRREVKQQLAVSLTERLKLLDTRRSNHPAIKDFDASIASLTWLAKIVQIEEGGPYKGMLVVPEQLVGQAASDIVAAFELAGTETMDLVPLYLKLLHLLPIDPRDDLQPLQHGSAFSPGSREIPVLKEPLAWRLPKLASDLDDLLWGPSTEDRSRRSSKPSDEQRTTRRLHAEPQIENELEKQFLVLNTTAQMTHETVLRVDSSLVDLKKNYSPLHLQVKTMNKERVDLLARISKLHNEASTLLGLALRSYVENLKTYRLESPIQKRLNRRILQPLAQLSDKTRCFDWGNAEAQQETWSNFSQKGTYFGRVHEYSSHIENQRKLANAQREILRSAFLSGNPDVRASAARYLKNNGLLTDELIDEALPPLKILLTDRDVERRYWGVFAIGFLEPVHEQLAVDLARVLHLEAPDYRGKRDEWRDLTRECLRVLGQLGPRARAANGDLEKALELADNGRFTIEIVKCLYQIDGLSERRISLISDVIQNPRRFIDPKTEKDWENQYYGRTGPSLNYRYESMRWQAIEFVGRITPARSEFIPPLTCELASRDALTVVTTLDALGRMGSLADDVRPKIQLLLVHSDEMVRQAALRALHNIRAGNNTPYHDP